MIQVTVPNFFYFAEISKMSELEPKNVDFSLISGNAHGRKKNFKFFLLINHMYVLDGPRASKNILYGFEI